MMRLEWLVDLQDLEISKTTWLIGRCLLCGSLWCNLLCNMIDLREEKTIKRIVKATRCKVRVYVVQLSY